MPKKKMTIDNLAIMMQKEFMSIHEEIQLGNASLDNKIETLRTEMHDEFRRIYEEINDIKKKLDQLSKRTDEDTRVTNEEIMKLKKRIELLEKEFKVLKARQGIIS